MDTSARPIATESSVTQLVNNALGTGMMLTEVDPSTSDIDDKYGKINGLKVDESSELKFNLTYIPGRDTFDINESKDSR